MHTWHTHILSSKVMVWQSICPDAHGYGCVALRLAYGLSPLPRPRVLRSGPAEPGLHRFFNLLKAFSCQESGLHYFTILPWHLTVRGQVCIVSTIIILRAFSCRGSGPYHFCNILKISSRWEPIRAAKGFKGCTGP